ncbi:hypothetical protein [Pyrobaculum aerophilum]|uniref:Uncharacterized protein n=2 Tax=Pyrobaculum aerophilum TaxID=13773 RepID=Q8ZSR0_PYRAE|nr:MULTISPECIES: hypothetical protein [Pyrobaculum]AAL65053.1 hypothetical protein PAE3625 [Pyrobaculum aerophilum str. IM2]RFA95478.1 hypothetical protein CGL51_07710 [Pyrobaculum aerophilum]RFA97131.1 hypothetical protein CGL52_10095 [Pyrobaculum aerophilum]HII47817.1 hypothetical protein [Pyrobaculum aerophilum]
MWLRIGHSEPRRFYNAVIWVIRASQLALYLSAVLFATGVLAASFGLITWHLQLMTSALVSFYFSVMYLQLPGFINAAPSVKATLLVTSAFLISAAQILPYPLLPLALVYIVLHLKALRGAPNYYPNWITVSGALTAAVAATPYEIIASFPLASVLTLMYRIDSSRGRKKFTVWGAGSIAAAHGAGFLLIKLGYFWGVALPLVVTSLAAPPKVRDVYGAGVVLGRVAMALGWLHHHFLYMGFAVVMAVLCVPYFLPSVVYRRVPKFSWENLAIALAAAALRLAGYIEIAAISVLALIAYVAYKILREEKVPLKPP